MTLALGIDTGGTYTDAALVEYETGRLLRSGKALTTKHDLAIGIGEAMARAVDGDRAQIGLVSLSTTLATNAIVEGKGAPACALLIGYRGHVSPTTPWAQLLGTQRYAFVDGGHDATGEASDDLDERAIVAAIREHAAAVQAFAVSGFFGPLGRRDDRPAHNVRP